MSVGKDVRQDAGRPLHDDAGGADCKEERGSCGQKKDAGQEWILRKMPHRRSCYSAQCVHHPDQQVPACSEQNEIADKVRADHEAKILFQQVPCHELDSYGSYVQPFEVRAALKLLGVSIQHDPATFDEEKPIA